MLFKRAEALRVRNVNDSALLLHKAALHIRLQLKPDSNLFNSYLVLAAFYMEDDKYEPADQMLEKARTLADSLSVSKTRQYDLYRRLSVCKREMNDYATAMSMARHLTEFVAPEDEDYNDHLADIHYVTGAIYLDEGDLGRAIEQWHQSVQLSSADWHRQRGIYYNAISIAQWRKGEFELALMHANRGIREDQQWAGSESLTLAARYVWKGSLLLTLRRFDSVLYFLQHGLNIRKKVLGEKSSDTFGARLSIGDYYHEVKRYDSAANYYHQSLVSLVGDFKNADLSSNPHPSDLDIHEDLVLGLSSKARALKNLYATDSARVDLLHLSLNTFMLADSVLLAMQRNLRLDDLRMNQLDNNLVPYNELIEIAYELYTKTGNERYVEKALHIMEHSRATVLNLALRRASALGATGVPDSVAAHENHLIKLRADLLQQLSASPGTSAVSDSLNRAFLALNDQLQIFHERLSHDYPNYYATRYENPAVGLTELKDFAVKHKATFLEFMWGNTCVFVIAVNNTGIKVRKVPLTETFLQSLAAFNREFRNEPESLISQDRFQSFCKSSHQLYVDLLQDVLKEVAPGSRLIISADGPLATISWESLITKLPPMNEVNYHLNYLMLNLPVSHAYSAGVLLAQAARERDGSRLLAFGYAGEVSGNLQRGSLTGLPGTAQEVNAIRDVMKNEVNEYQLEGDASEATFKRVANQFDVIHIAVHGQGDSVNALNSKLIFRTDKDTLEDGNLYAHEIYDLNLSNLDMVVLSACETGVGKPQAGEGVMSMARGFAYAGCPSLVMSFWKLDDETASQVMGSFYRYLSHQNPIDVSLSLAKQDYIKDASEFYSHPSYWAAFVAVGKMDSLKMATHQTARWILAIVLLAAGAVLLRRIHKARSFRGRN